MESPLMLSVARQLVVGPWELYGPFGGSNPLVLIHAPLYYRAAALLAWPMARAGLHPVDAARLAGRLISALGPGGDDRGGVPAGTAGRAAAAGGVVVGAAGGRVAGARRASRSPCGPTWRGWRCRAGGCVLVLEGLSGPRAAAWRWPRRSSACRRA